MHDLLGVLDVLDVLVVLICLCAYVLMCLCDMGAPMDVGESRRESRRNELKI